MTDLLKAKLLSESDYVEAAKALGCEVAAIKAVAEVESAGNGFILDTVAQTPVPKILFERHISRRQIAAARTDPMKIPSDICQAKRGGYLGGFAEHTRLAKATEYGRTEALNSASWGKFQIMGFNYELCGYKTLQAFINDMYANEGGHLRAFVGFIKSNPNLLRAIRTKNCAAFALGYNGKAYKENNYDVKMENSYKRHAKIK